MITQCLWQRRNMIKEKQPTWALSPLSKVILKVKELLTKFLDVQRKPHRDV